MSLTVAEVMPLEAFNTFRLIAGEAGLKRKIQMVGMLDYELGDMIEQNFREDEFVITTLVAIKDDLSQLETMVERLIKIKSSGFAIKTIYISEVPQVVIDLCEREAYPLFLFDETFFEIIITSVNDVLKTQDELEDLEIQIDRLLSGDMNKYGIRRAAQLLNRSFLENVQVAYVKNENRASANLAGVFTLNQVNQGNRQHKCIPYQSGYLVIISAPLSDANLFTHPMNHIFSQLGIDSHYIQGFSQIGIKLDKLDVAIHEALYACETAKRYQLPKLLFSEMGLDRLLLPVKDNPWVMAYYEAVMTPLLAYDQKNGTQLLRTSVIFILCGGDIKRAAERLYQHGNTVRYRMERIRQLLCESRGEETQSEWSFYEMLAVGVRLHLIYTDDL